MAKYNSEIIVGFDIQTQLGTYNASLDLITSGGNFDGDSSGTDTGLLLGDPDSGINGSGLTLTLGRRGKEQSVIGSSLSRPISLLEVAEVSSFQFAFLFGGNLSNTTPTTPVDGDFVQLTAVDAILRGLGLVSNTTVLSPGVQYTPSSGTQEYVSALMYIHGSEVQLQDCAVTSLTITDTPGSATVAVADFAVGVVKLPNSSTPPTPPTIPSVDYGNQNLVSPAICENVGHSWNHSRGFSTSVLTISNTTASVPDSNQDDGVVIEITDRESKITSTMYNDDASTNEGYTLSQLLVDAEGDLDQLSYRVGSVATGTSAPARAMQIVAPKPELVSAVPTNIGKSAGYDVELILRSPAASENGELEINFE